MATRASPSARNARRAAARAPATKSAPSEERYALALESLNYGIYDWDIEAGTVYYAPSLRIMLGLSEAEMQRISGNEISMFMALTLPISPTSIGSAHSSGMATPANGAGDASRRSVKWKAISLPSSSRSSAPRLIR